LEAAGLSVRIVPGDENNLKVTTQEDLRRMEELMSPHQSGRTLPDIRTGSGYDVHRIGPGDGVTLCGVNIACDMSLVGHSDADVALHAVTDALLGAIAKGDIGSHFPPSDPQWRGASSDRFLRHAVELMRTDGYALGNIDLTIICERPKVGPHRDTMRAKLAEICGIAVERVSVKATTTERLGFTGRGEGIAAEAVVTVIGLS
jgi:2-C-methyl-D-erythritol 4-phosphate cytidylyltransferase/2-C-methyl-D-erythritol 2,4-cyclodiphosphate synthase